MPNLKVLIFLLAIPFSSASLSFSYILMICDIFGSFVIKLQENISQKIWLVLKSKINHKEFQMHSSSGYYFFG